MRKPPVVIRVSPALLRLICTIWRKFRLVSKKRLQAFEGVVIAIRNRGLHSAFTVRKISNGEGVERVFQTHSPVVDSITVKRRGAVRKAKLYYLRDVSNVASGKSESGLAHHHCSDFRVAKAGNFIQTQLAGFASGLDNQIFHIFAGD